MLLAKESPVSSESKPQYMSKPFSMRFDTQAGLGFAPAVDSAMQFGSRAKLGNGIDSRFTEHRLLGVGAFKVETSQVFS